MTDNSDVSPRRKLVGVAVLSALFVLPAPVLAQNIYSVAAVASDPLRLAAEDAASCREVRDPEVRLACLDAAADRLAEALDSSEQAGRGAADLPVSPDAPATPVADGSSSDAADLPISPDAPDAPTAVEPPSDASEQPPDWAAAPEQHDDAEPGEDPERFEATIVRITRNNVGRHRFYTADGAIWEQTQLVDVRQPESLPAVAEFRRKLTGNPTIKFDVSSRTYRVKRIK